MVLTTVSESNMGGKGIGYFVNRGQKGFRGFVKPSADYPIQTLHWQINTLLRPKPAPGFIAYNIKLMDEVKPYWDAAIAEATRTENGGIPQIWLDSHNKQWTVEEAYEAIQVEATKERGSNGDGPTPSDNTNHTGKDPIPPSPPPSPQMISETKAPAQLTLQSRRQIEDDLPKGAEGAHPHAVTDYTGDEVEDLQPTSNKGPYHITRQL